jgi:hypothetical protein
MPLIGRTGRLMHTFCELLNQASITNVLIFSSGRNQYLNFHGQPCARLSVDQTVRGWSYKPSIYMTIFAPLLCMAPVAHVRSLHTSFVDDLASTSEWKIFITRLNGQLQNLNLLVSQISLSPHYAEDDFSRVRYSLVPMLVF